MSSTAIDELEKILGFAVARDDSALDAVREDKSGYRSDSRPAAVVEVRTAADVQKVLQFANERRIPVVTRGAGTGLAGGATAGNGEIVLSTLRMNRILDLNPDDQTAVVEPGLLNGELNDSLREFGLWYPPDPASRAISTIGGNIATNAGGLLCAQYGVTRESVLALSVVLADGRSLNLGRGTVKGVTGLDLTSLFIGSEGTLGVIVAATLRLRSLPPGPTVTIQAEFDRVDAAARAATDLSRSGLNPASMELMDEISVRLIGKYLKSGPEPRPGARLVVQFDDGAAQSDAARAVDLLEAGARKVEVSADAASGEDILAFRRAFHPALAANGRVLIEDVAVPRSKLGQMFEEIARIGEKFGLEIPTVAHAADGNLHPNFMIEGEEIPDSVWEAAGELFRSALALGGTLTGEHGVGLLKRRWLAEELGDDQVSLQKEIKRVFDPRGILNPGKVY
ncbi:MAG: FAD-binding protein [Microbacteriaceae bacterium]|nr:FAD-binding protein [Microbacteriaceae bacterium]